MAAFSSPTGYNYDSKTQITTKLLKGLFNSVQPHMQTCKAVEEGPFPICGESRLALNHLLKVLSGILGFVERIVFHISHFPERSVIFDLLQCIAQLPSKLLICLPFGCQLCLQFLWLVGKRLFNCCLGVWHQVAPRQPQPPPFAQMELTVILLRCLHFVPDIVLHTLPNRIAESHSPPSPPEK